MAGDQKGRVGGAVSHGHSVGGRFGMDYRTWLSMRLRCRQKPTYQVVASLRNQILVDYMEEIEWRRCPDRRRGYGSLG